MIRFFRIYTIATLLTAHIGFLSADEESDINPAPAATEADTAIVDTIVDMSKNQPTGLGPLVPYTGIESRTAVTWWPLDMGRAFEGIGYRSDWKGLIAAPAFPGGLPKLETPGYIWMGIPWTGIQEIGGDATTLLPLSTSHILRSHNPAYISGGRSTVYFVPLMDPIITPHTRIQTLRGPRRDTLYGLDFGTRATGLISSEVAIGYRETDGDRTNSESTMKQYDWRVDLQPPVIGPCTILNHVTETDRGVPGPHPSYWNESDSSDSLLVPRYWAVDQGYGTEDAMWSQGNEILSTNLLALRFMQLVRDRVPLHLSIVRDRAWIKTSITDPVISDSTASGIPLEGECSADRTAFSGRLTFAENGIDSVWSTISVERIKRRVDIELSADTITVISWDETTRRSVLGVGAQIGSMEALLSLARGTETRFAGALNTEKKFGDLILSGSCTYSWDERRLDDILRWHVQSYSEPPRNKGDTGIIAVGVSHEYPGGTIEGSCSYGFGNEVWGWCFADSIPAGELTQWGPLDPTIAGFEFSIDHGLFTWLRFNGHAAYNKWRLDGAHVPGIPDLYSAVSLTFDYPVQRRAHPHGVLQLRHVGNRFWGVDETFERDAYFSLDGWLSVDIGDFSILLIAQNITGAKYEAIPGYPILDRSIHFGFHWKFLD